MKSLKNTLSFFKDYRDLILSIIFITLLSLDILGIAPNGEDISYQYYYIITFIFFLTLSIIYSLFKQQNKVNKSTFIKEIKKQLKHTKTPFFIRIINTSFSKDIRSLPEKIKESKYWDWTFITPSTECNNIICNNLSKELIDEYSDESSIKTSTISITRKAINNNNNYIFFGHIISAVELSKEINFLPDPFEIESNPSYSIFFDKLFIFSPQYSNDEQTCSIIKPRIITDSKVIEKKWDQIKHELEKSIDFSCFWNEKLKTKKEHEKVLKIFAEHTSKECKPYIKLNNPKSLLLKIRNNKIRHKFTHIAFYFGLLLSPFTLWNDAFINIPISTIITWLIYQHLEHNQLIYSALFGSTYILTNIIGILIMWLAGKKIFVKWSNLKPKNYFTILIYLILANIITYLASSHIFST